MQYIHICYSHAPFPFSGRPTTALDIRALRYIDTIDDLLIDPPEYNLLNNNIAHS
jgi:hypothetical protein